MANNQKHHLGDIPWREVIFLVDDLKQEPVILDISKDFFKKVGIRVRENDIKMLQKLTKGLLIKVWLDHGGKIV